MQKNRESQLDRENQLDKVDQLNKADILSASARPVMVFHAPYPLEASAASGSRLRPTQMRNAFQELGYEVFEITGDTKERAAAFRRLRKLIAAGLKVEFVYGENSTQPNFLATSIKKRPAPFLEARIFAYFRRHRIPVGVFYRDIYWKFPAALDFLPIWQRLAMQILYRFDLWVMRRARVHLFLPSKEMASYVPYPPHQTSPLPPGAVVRESTTPAGLHIFYVGGLGAHYGLQKAVEVLAKVPDVHLTMCVRKEQWEALGEQFMPYLSERIRIVHGSSAELAPFYDEAALGLLFLEPNEYRTFATPIKLYEYLGYGKAIIASEGTLAGEVVKEKAIGFTIPYRRESLQKLLEELAADPEKLSQAIARAQVVRHQETWRARAKTAAAELKSL